MGGFLTLHLLNANSIQVMMISIGSPNDEVTSSKKTKFLAPSNESISCMTIETATNGAKMLVI